MKSASGDAPSLLDSKQLQLFDVLYATCSVTAAAALLGQTQPTVSTSLARLRRQLRDPLFVRTQAGMKPTPRADKLIGPARELLEGLRRLSLWDDTFMPATAQRRFCICMTDASHITLLPELLASVRAAAPQVRLEAARIDDTTAGRLESGQADLALGYIPSLESGIYQQTLFPQDWVCLASQGHPRIGKTLGISEYAKEGHVGVVAGTAYQLLEAGLARHRISRRLVLELPGFLGLGGIVAGSDLIVTLPRHIGETLAKVGGLRVFDCPITLPRFTVKQHWHVRYHKDPGNQWLRAIIAQLFLQRRVRGA